MFNKTIFSAGIITMLLASPAYAGANAVPPALPASSTVVMVAAKAEDANATKARGFIESLAKRGIGFLSNAELSEEKRKQEFSDLLQDNFDMKTIGRFAVGRYWKTMSEKERAEYLKLFDAMILSVYSRRFSEYNGQKFNVTGARMEGDKDSIVSSAIVPVSGPEIRVDWRVRNNNGTLKVVDIMVEGVSMSMTQRADFASVIQRGGGQVSVLIEHLKSF